MSSEKISEERIEELEAENENLREQVEELQSAVANLGVNEAIETELDEEEVEGLETDNDGEPLLGKSTRRGVLASMAAAGVLGAGMTGSASAQQGTALEFGGTYTGTGGSNNRALEIQETSGDGSSIGMRAGTDAPGGTGIRAFASATSGRSIALSAVSQSPDGVGVQGQAAATSGNPIGLLGIADYSGATALQGTNRATSGTALGVGGRTDSSEGVGVRGRATASSGTNYGVWGTTNSPDGYGLYTPDNARVEGNQEVSGDLQVQGTKNFVQAVETPTGTKEVVYTAVEAGMPRTEATDVAELSDGRTEIDLPEHFEMVTSEEEPLSVQVTPYADEEANPQVVEHSTEKIVVEDFSDGAREYTFAYTVKGVREGFEDREIVQDS